MKQRNPFRIIISLLLLTMLVIPLVAKGAPEQIVEASDYLSVIDWRGELITLDKEPQRIVSLSPNVTETLFALGLGDKIVGRTDYCDYPSEVFDIVSVGDLMTPSIEKIISLEPDVVIISNIGQKETVEALDRAHIKIAYFDEDQDMEGTYSLIEKVGQLTGTKQVAEQLISSMRDIVSEVQHSNVGKNRPTAYYVTGFGEWGDFTATGDTYLHDIITLAGADNIASSGSGWSFQLESLIASDPDVIIMAPMWGSSMDESIEEFKNHSFYSSLSAVKNNTIFGLEENILERQGPRSAQAVKELSDAITALGM
ncbi:MAG: ABC transporter substrate-binding protein [Sphaerochaetaceae bacterium]|jgi:iron complex transport system substrate-binding protein